MGGRDRGRLGAGIYASYCGRMLCCFTPVPFMRVLSHAMGGSMAARTPSRRASSWAPDNITLPPPGPQGRLRVAGHDAGSPWDSTLSSAAPMAFYGPSTGAMVSHGLALPRIALYALGFASNAMIPGLFPRPVHHPSLPSYRPSGGAGGHRLGHVG